MRTKIDLATGRPLNNLHRSEAEFSRMAVVASVLGNGSVVPSTCDTAFKVLDALDRYDRAIAAPKPPGQEPGGDPGVGRGEEMPLNEKLLEIADQLAWQMGESDQSTAPFRRSKETAHRILITMLPPILPAADRDAIRESATTMMRAFYEARGGHFADGLSAKAETAHAKLTDALALLGRGRWTRVRYRR